MWFHTWGLDYLKMSLSLLFLYVYVDPFFLKSFPTDIILCCILYIIKYDALWIISSKKLF